MSYDLPPEALQFKARIDQMEPRLISDDERDILLRVKEQVRLERGNVTLGKRGRGYAVLAGLTVDLGKDNRNAFLSWVMDDRVTSATELHMKYLFAFVLIAGYTKDEETNKWGTSPAWKTVVSILLKVGGQQEMELEQSTLFSEEQMPWICATCSTPLRNAEQVGAHNLARGYCRQCGKMAVSAPRGALASPTARMGFL